MEFDHDLLLEVISYHERISIDQCGCGWTDTYKVYPEHLLEVYETSARLRTPEPIKAGDTVRVPGGKTGEVLETFPAHHAARVTFGYDPTVHIFMVEELERA